RYARAVPDAHLERPARARRPHAAVLRAERARARARRDLGRLGRPIKGERHVAAVAAADNQHGLSRREYRTPAAAQAAAGRYAAAVIRAGSPAVPPDS